MHPTLFHFPMDGHSILALEMTTPSMESMPSERWKTGCSAADAEDGCPCSLDSYWIDFGGEG